MAPFTAGLGLGHALQVRAERERADGREGERVTVGRRLGDGIDPGRRARAGLVLDDDRLPERRVQALAEQPRDRVARAARGVGHDDADRLDGPVVAGEYRAGRGRENGGGDGGERVSARESRLLHAGDFNCRSPTPPFVVLLASSS